MFIFNDIKSNNEAELNLSVLNIKPSLYNIEKFAADTKLERGGNFH